MLLQLTYQNMYKSWRVFRKGKKASKDIDEFAYYLEENLVQLCTEIADQTFKHGAYKSVIVHEKKRRDLAVVSSSNFLQHPVSSPS